MTFPACTMGFRLAVRDALILQAVVLVFAALVLDGGQMFQYCLVALAAFWGGVGVRVWRNPGPPGFWGLKLIRFGFLPVVFATPWIIEIVCGA